MQGGPPFPAHAEEVTMCAPHFGLSTTPVMEIKSELRLQLERDLLALLYRAPRRAAHDGCGYLAAGSCD
jgi:hypothetical protein